MKFALLALLSFTISFSHAQNNANRTNLKGFSVMSYNAENFFDAQHDKGTTDYPYLPVDLKRSNEEYKAGATKSCLHNGQEGSSGWKRCFYENWTDQVFDKKAAQLAKAISFYNNGKGADIVVLQEVENQNAMDRLMQKANDLKMGYVAAKLINDQDERGIDVGILSKYPITLAKVYSGKTGGPIKRGIYRYDVKIKGMIVTFLGNHWPSQGHPVSDRLIASDLLLNVSDKVTQSDLVIALGDFNSPEIKTENPHPVHALYSDYYDSHLEAEKSIKVFPGSYCYQRNWNILDRILVRKMDVDKNAKIVPDFKSFKVISDDSLMGSFNYSCAAPGKDKPVSPLRFNSYDGSGFSDHLPSAMNFIIK